MKERTVEQILTCRDLSVGYDNTMVLQGLNLAFERGRFVSLLGPNGAGKTTLLRTFSRHINPLGGRIEVMGRPLAHLTAMELAQSMAVVLTDRVSPPLFSVFEFVSLGRYPHTDFLGRLQPADIEAVENALAAVHAEDLVHRPFSDLSDGERQKALVARALAQAPRLLLLDEPTIHLDLKHRMEIMSILRDLCHTRGITVVASLHDVDLAAKVSDRVALVKKNHPVRWGPPEEVLTGTTVADLYDFTGAAFSSRLGGIELRGEVRQGRAFVVAGMGSGAPVYRILAKRGVAIATGVLHANDLDTYVAQALGAECTIQDGMEAIQDNAVADAAEKLKTCDVVIDCGFQVGTMNRENMDLLGIARKRNLPIISLRRDNGNVGGRLDDPSPPIDCQTTAEFAVAIDSLFPREEYHSGMKDK